MIGYTRAVAAGRPPFSSEHCRRAGRPWSARAISCASGRSIPRPWSRGHGMRARGGARRMRRFHPGGKSQRNPRAAEMLTNPASVGYNEPSHYESFSTRRRKPNKPKARGILANLRCVRPKAGRWVRSCTPCGACDRGEWQAAPRGRVDQAGWLPPGLLTAGRRAVIYRVLALFGVDPGRRRDGQRRSDGVWRRGD
jgi:hypothetical protein